MYNKGHINMYDFFFNNNIFHPEELNFTNDSVKFIFSDDNNLMFGIGLCTKKIISIDLPIDVISYLLYAERLRNCIKITNVYIIIADIHAINNGFCEIEINCISDYYIFIIENIISQLNLKKIQIIKASSYFNTPNYLSILNKININASHYEKLEIADIEFFRKYYNVTIKLGWAYLKKNNKHDERYFDNIYQNIFSHKLVFLYIKPGLKIVNNNLYYVSPYIETDKNSIRLFFNANSVELINNYVDNIEWKKYYDDLGVLLKTITYTNNNSLSIKELVNNVTISKNEYFNFN